MMLPRSSSTLLRIVGVKRDEVAGKALILILILKSGSSGRTKGRGSPGWRGMVGPESSDIKHHMGIQAFIDFKGTLS